jgi:hypothetical protein
MPGYLSKAFLQFNHQTSETNQNSPYSHVAAQYGAKTQYTVDEDIIPLLNKEEAKYI